MSGRTNARPHGPLMNAGISLIGVRISFLPPDGVPPCVVEILAQGRWLEKLTLIISLPVCQI
jgi:hypothetical protein